MSGWTGQRRGSTDSLACIRCTLFKRTFISHSHSYSHSHVLPFPSPSSSLSISFLRITTLYNTTYTRCNGVSCSLLILHLDPRPTNHGNRVSCKLIGRLVGSAGTVAAERKGPRVPGWRNGRTNERTNGQKTKTPFYHAHARAHTHAEFEGGRRMRG